MAKFGQPRFIVVVFKDGKYLKVNGEKEEWIDNPQDANKYASKYVAKNHLKRLTINADSVEYVELK